MRAQLLVLAVGPGGGAAVDLTTGGLVRARWVEPPPSGLRAYDVVHAELARDDSFPFPRDSRLARGVTPAGKLRGRKAERVLRPLVHPVTQPLLGAAAPWVPYWTLRDDQPSLALLAPSSGPSIDRDAANRPRCRFRWRRLDHNLPLDDPAVDERLSHPTATHLTGSTLARALGWRPHRLLVALAPPASGQCSKVVAALLPKP